MIYETIFSFALIIFIGLIANRVSARKRADAHRASADDALTYGPRLEEEEEAGKTVVNYTTNPVFHGWGCNVFGDAFEDRRL